MARVVRPDADITTGAWTPTPLWSKLADALDSTFIAAPDGQDNVTCELRLADVTDPESSVDHTIRWRRRVDAGNQCSLTVQLRQGGALIASFTESGLSNTAFANAGFTLSASEANAITDYNDLRLRLIASDFSGLGLDHVEVAFVEFEVPNVRVPLSMSAAGTAALSATLDSRTPLYPSGALYPSATLFPGEAQEEAAGALSASVAAQGLLESTLSAHAPLSAAVASEAALGSDLRLRSALSAAVASEAALGSGPLSRIRLAASFPAQSSLEAALMASGAFEVNIAAGGVLAAALRSRAQLVAAPAAAAELDAPLRARARVVSAFVSVADLDALLRQRRQMSGAPSGLASLAASLGTVVAYVHFKPPLDGEIIENRGDGSVVVATADGTVVLVSAEGQAIEVVAAGDPISVVTGGTVIAPVAAGIVHEPVSDGTLA